METVVAVLIGVVLGALAVVFGRRLLEGGGGPPGMAPQCGALVKLSLAGTTIHASPANVCLHRGRALTWEIGSPGEVDIEFEIKGSDKGPFPHDPENPHNKAGRGSYKRSSPGDVGSNPAELTGRWKYAVKWKPPDGDAVTLDPEVCIRD